MTKKTTRKAAPRKAEATNSPVILIDAKVADKINYRANTARDAYFQMIRQYDGKPLAEFIAAVAKNPPSYPKRGKLQGKPEPITGWLTFFIKAGFLKIA